MLSVGRATVIDIQEHVLGWTTDEFDPPLPPEPTRAVPGSSKKLEVLRERAELGFALHHPADDRTLAPSKAVDQSRNRQPRTVALADLSWM